MTTQQIILAAANSLVRREGVLHLTIEAVAREAGLSKGGVLYHFATKEALIAGMIERMIDQFESDLKQAENEEGGQPGSWLRAYIKTSTSSEELSLDNTSSLIAAIANNPELLIPFQQRYVLWQSQAENAGPNPALGTLIRLAVDGLWMAELFGLAAPTDQLREQVIKLMFELSLS